MPAKPKTRSVFSYVRAIPMMERAANDERARPETRALAARAARMLRKNLEIYAKRAGHDPETLTLEQMQAIYRQARYFP